MSKLKGYRTVLFNIVMAATAVANQFGAEIDAPALVGGLDALDAAIAGIWAGGNLALRAITDTPIFRKE